MREDYASGEADSKDIHTHTHTHLKWFMESVVLGFSTTIVR